VPKPTALPVPVAAPIVVAPKLAQTNADLLCDFTDDFSLSALDEQPQAPPLVPASFIPNQPIAFNSMQTAPPPTNQLLTLNSIHPVGGVVTPAVNQLPSHQLQLQPQLQPIIPVQQPQQATIPSQQMSFAMQQQQQLMNPQQQQILIQQQILQQQLLQLQMQQQQYQQFQQPPSQPFAGTAVQPGLGLSLLTTPVRSPNSTASSFSSGIPPRTSSFDVAMTPTPLQGGVIVSYLKPVILLIIITYTY